MVAIIQPFWKEGSLRDAIYGNDPTKDWAEKYTGVGHPLPVHKVKTYGRQILQVSDAFCSLYKGRH